MYIGPIYQLAPAQGSSGQSVTVKIPPGSIARFRTTSNHRALFAPMVMPPGIPVGIGGVTTFGYPVSFQRIDDFTAIVVVPQIGSNPRIQMAPGRHKLIVATSWDWGDSATIFNALASSPAPGAGIIPLPTLPGFPSSHGLPAPFIPASSPAPTSIHIPVAPASIYIPVTTPIHTPPVGSSGLTPSVSSPEPEPEPRPELIVRWLPEVFSPKREGPGPVMMKPKGVTGLKAPIPVESSSPPVRQFDFIISAELRDGDEPVRNERVRWDLVRETDTPGDDTELLDVSDELLPLKRKLKANASPAYTLQARTNADGKTYCWIRLRLFDERTITDPRLLLRGFKIIIGDPERERPPSDVTASVVPASPATVFASAAGTGHLFAPLRAGNPPNPPPPWWQRLVDVLVDPLEQAATSAVYWVGERTAEAVAALPRTWQEVIGFALNRFADGYMMMGGIYFWAQHMNVLDQVRAATIGAFLGLPRGLWVMARDQLQDIKTLVFDLPRALWNFIAEDPKFALEVVASLWSPTLGQVVYHLDPDFKKKIDQALSRFANLAAALPGQIVQLWHTLAAVPIGSLIEAAGDAIYSSFKNFVGDIATDYLRLPKDSPSYHFFVGGFIAGDFLGYILGTVGVQLLLAYLTAGIGTWVAGMAKLARAQRVLVRIAGLVDKIVDVFRQIKVALQALGGAIKDGIGRVLMAFARFYEALDDAFIEPAVEALHAQAQKMIRWLHRCCDVAEADQLGACARALRAKLAHAPGEARRVLHLLADFSEQGFLAGC